MSVQLLNSPWRLETLFKVKELRDLREESAFKKKGDLRAFLDELAGFRGSLFNGTSIRKLLDRYPFLSDVEQVLFWP